MAGPKEDLSDEVLELTRELESYVNDIHSALDSYIDHEKSLSEAEQTLKQGYKAYERTGDVIERVLIYGDEQSHRKDDLYEQTEEELASDDREVVELLPMNEARRDYEDALFRYIGIENGLELHEYRDLHDLLSEEDVELPDEIDPDVLEGDEILDNTK